jgi:hypothetical protein
MESACESSSSDTRTSSSSSSSLCTTIRGGNAPFASMNSVLARRCPGPACSSSPSLLTLLFALGTFPGDRTGIPLGLSARPGGARAGPSSGKLSPSPSLSSGGSSAIALRGNCQLTPAAKPGERRLILPPVELGGVVETAFAAGFGIADEYFGAAVGCFEEDVGCFEEVDFEVGSGEVEWRDVVFDAVRLERAGRGLERPREDCVLSVGGGGGGGGVEVGVDDFIAPPRLCVRVRACEGIGETERRGCAAGWGAFQLCSRWCCSSGSGELAREECVESDELGRKR